ncbi:MAG: KpsF/GutQ family sugar-phosphate isomerase [Planctomycetaceae bacterium]|nr:KpsF/GutQ family sugar-phosphate isomerase [Planctomycetaceae bacterium]
MINESDRQTFQDVLQREANAIVHLSHQIDGMAIGRAVELVHNCNGRCVFVGMGKMGAVGRKAAATFASLGSPAMFVQPAEALHGDLGMITAKDLVFALSYSGETDEVLRVVETVRPWDVSVIAFTQQNDNSLTKVASVVLDIRVPQEAIDQWPVPTCSTTAAMAVCDALAIVVMQKRGFSIEDFSRLHPGGSLGRKLRVRVAELMHTGSEVPIVPANATLRDAIIEMTKKSLGATMIAASTGQLLGLITDGDIRRTVQKFENPLDKPVEEFMTSNPRTCSPGGLAAAALAMMESCRVTVLPVVDGHRIVGMVHFHDLVRARLA